MKKTIIVMQWITTFVSNVMNHTFLSPTVFGVGNLRELVRLKEEKKLAVFFISNHCNANDPFVETAFLPMRVKEKVFPITFLTYYEKFNGRTKSFLMEMLGCISVGGGSSENAREIIKRIKKGDSIYLFPEGMVSSDGKLGADQGALEKFSRLSDLIVQPIYTEGLKPFWDLKNMFFFRRNVHVSFGVPFVLEKGSKIDAMQLIKNVSRGE